jgi:hypothetical protein
LSYTGDKGLARLEEVRKLVYRKDESESVAHIVGEAREVAAKESRPFEKVEACWASLQQLIPMTGGRVGGSTEAEEDSYGGAVWILTALGQDDKRQTIKEGVAKKDSFRVWFEKLDNALDELAGLLSRGSAGAG